MAAGGKPSIHIAQGIACSQGLACAEPMLRGGNGGTARCTVPSQSLQPPHRGRQKSGPSNKD